MNVKTQGWIVLPFSIASWSYVIYKMWGWFIVQTFNVNQISYAQSLGLWMFFILVRIPHKSELKEEYKEEDKSPVGKLVIPWVYLLISYIVHSIQTLLC